MQLAKTNHVTVNVIDAIMGSGKTTWMIEKINNDLKPRYIVVTPTLDEVARLINDCPKARFKAPDDKGVHGKKYADFEQLIKDGENIVTTHSLLSRMTTKILDALKKQQYTLMVDESLAVVSVYKELTSKDMTMLFNGKYVYVEPDSFKLRWNHKDHPDYKGKFWEIREKCDNGNLIHFQKNTMLWEFPIEFLRVFKDVWVLTYLFQSSPMANYLLADGTKVNLYSLKGQSSKFVPPTLIDYKDHDETAVKDILRSPGVINLYDGPLNDIGKPSLKAPKILSKNWYTTKAKPKDIEAVKNAIYNYFRHVIDAKSVDLIWTVFGSKKTKKNKRYGRGIVEKLEGKGYARGFIPNNTKATNDYIDRKHIAYMQNTFHHPKIFDYFKARGVIVIEDLYSLSEMIQLIWRSRIRKWESIDVFIPSSRMRHLFKCWLNTNSSSELKEALKKE